MTLYLRLNYIQMTKYLKKGWILDKYYYSENVA